MSFFDALPKFLTVGLLNTMFALLIIFVAKGLLGLGDGVSNGIGYAVGLVMSFVLNRRWTFNHDGPISRALIAFIFVQFLAYLANLLCVLMLIDHGVNGYWAQVLGIPPYTLISFLGSRFIVFPVEASVRKY